MGQVGICVVGVKLVDGAMVVEEAEERDGCEWGSWREAQPK